jgi:GNAT superfamily N-acetyltransferase
VTAEVVIRSAVEEDVEDIARVHIRTWQTAYAGQFPAERLDTLDETFERRREMWHKYITAPENGQVLFVAAVEGEVVGFAGGEKERTGEWPFEGELTVIYILEEHQKKGIGRRLMEVVAQALVDGGMGSLVVWVLGTSPYRAFYEAMGGVFVGEQEYEIWDEKYKVAGYGWERLEELAGEQLS